MNQEAIDCSQWVDRYGNNMFRFALLRVNDEGQAEDIVQNTFLAALKGKDSFSGLSSEKTWLFGILKHKIMDHFRELKKNRKYGLQMDDDQDPCESDFDSKGHWQALPVSWGINPQKASENRQLMEVLSKCMNRLSDKFRQLFILREIEGFTSEKICEEWNITPGNLWVILHRTRNQLKKCLEAHMFDAKSNA